MSVVAIITAAALAASVPPTLLLSVCYVETSHTNVVSPTDGRRASYGHCQVQLRTARIFNKHVHPSELLIPEENARYAALYLSYQLRRYRGDVCRAVVAYNAGNSSFDSRLGACNNRYSSKVMKTMRDMPWKY